MQKIVSKSVLTLIAVIYSTASFAFTLPTGEDLQDPTAPHNAKPRVSNSTSASVAKPKPLVLNYLKNSGGEKIAVINGATLKEGDSIRGMRVVEITDSAVRLKNGNRERWVRLNASSGITRK